MEEFRQQEGLRMKFKEVGAGITFSIPKYKDVRKFLLWEKDEKGKAKWAGFKADYKNHGILSSTMMSYQGQTIEIGEEEEVEIVQ